MNLLKMTPIIGPRIFGVGFNKTGTTTLGACFDILGLGPVARPQAIHDAFVDDSMSHLVAAQDDLFKNRNAFFETFPYRAICREVFDYGNYGLSLHMALGFRAFHDRPWNVGGFYKILDQLFPDSLFILTTRDSRSWWESVDRWLNVTHFNDKEKRYRYLKHLGVDALNKESCIAAYLAHNDSIRNYFNKKPESFLELRMESDFHWKPLCEFLNIAIPTQPFPHQNQQLY